MSTRLYQNPAATRRTVPAPGREPLQFHRRLPGYVATRLAEAPALAAELGIGKLLIKDESGRLGLPSFKILGASWAVYGALTDLLGREVDPWDTIRDLAALLAPLRPLTLLAATDGNHGRAVAHMAALLGLDAWIFVPRGTATARIDAIRAEGARVTIVDGSYDDAVRRSAEEAGERAIVISDTAWPGYVDVPRRVIDGYSTIFWEIDAELAQRRERGPDVVLVQMGVGALAAAAIGHYRRADLLRRPRIVGVEPEVAACVLQSLQAGAIVEVPGPHNSIMAGLNCGIPSIVAWPLLSSGLDLCVAVPDERARQAMRALGAAGVVAGETGAAGVAGLIELLSGPDANRIRDLLQLDHSSRVLAICTEGATDPAAYRRILSGGA